MKKSTKFTIETQTEDRETISLCHINLPVIALETSSTARKMFKLNRSLFDKINSNVKLISGKVYRLEVTRNKKSFNKNGVPIENAYEYNEVNVALVYFDKNNKIKKIQRYKSDTGRYFDHDPSRNNEEQNKSMINYGYLTDQDIEQMQMTSEIQQIDLFQDMGIVTFTLKDNLNTGKAYSAVAYRLELLCNADFDEYINYTLSKLMDSITFLQKYTRIVNFKSNYNFENESFTDSFRKSVFEPLDMDGASNINLGIKRIKNSDFGKSAIAFYNSSKLLSPNIDKTVYDDIIKSLMPFRNNSPKKISLVLKSFEDLYLKIKNEYGIAHSKLKKNSGSIKVQSKNSSNKIFFGTTTEKFYIENQKLGYNLFSEKQKGINSFTRSSYAGRVNQERAKYFPSMNVKDETNFLTSKERANFADLSNASSYITPSNLILGDKKISTERGMVNMDAQAVKNFRLAKSARAAAINVTNYPSVSRLSNDKSVLSAFNVTIRSPKTSLLDRAVEEKIDPLIDAKLYLGDNNFFVTTNPFFLRDAIKRISASENSKVLSIATNIVNRSFLRQEGALDSVREIQFSNKKSRMRKLAEKKELAIDQLPPHIKYMCTANFVPNPNIDPLKSNETREIVEETQKNVFVVKGLIGFKKDVDGFFDLNIPIIEDLSKINMDGKPVLAKAYYFEMPEIGVVKDKFLATIYNNLLYIKG